MSKRSMSPKTKSKGGKLLPALCNLFGIIIFLAVISSCLAIVVPQLSGYQVYHVISGSMAPKMPVGSIVYVKPTEPESIQTDDIIAFQSGDSVITHRVVRNNIVEGKFTTKGDANLIEDENPVGYDELIGKVVLYCPYLGELLVVYSGTVGKIYIVLFAACGAMLNILANRLRMRYNEQAEALR